MLTVRILPQWSRKLYTKARHKNGLAFLPNKQYAVQGFDRQDTDGYVILVNEYNELWWISNRHVRVVTNTDTYNMALHLQNLVLRDQLNDHYRFLEIKEEAEVILKKLNYAAKKNKKKKS